MSVSLDSMKTGDSQECKIAMLSHALLHTTNLKVLFYETDFDIRKYSEL